MAAKERIEATDARLEINKGRVTVNLVGVIDRKNVSDIDFIDIPKPTIWIVFGGDMRS